MKEEKSKNYYEQTPQLESQEKSKFREHLSQGLGVLIIVAAALVCYFLFLRFSYFFDKIKLVVGILSPIIYGLVIAYLLTPIVNWLEKWLVPVLEEKQFLKGRSKKYARSISILCAELFMCWIVFLLIYMIIPELYTSIENLILTLPTLVNDAIVELSTMSFENQELENYIALFLEDTLEGIETWLKTDLINQTNNIMSNLTIGVIGVVVTIFDVIMGIIVSVYVLASKETFAGQSKKVIYALCSPQQANVALHIAHKSNKIFGGFIVGKIIDSTIIGIICFIGLSILSMPYTLLISVVIGVTNVIPFFGPYIGAVPCGVLLLLTDPMKCLYFVIFIIVLQQLDGNIIGPKILGDSTGLSSFWVIFAIVVAGGLFGFVGMVIGVPTFAVIYYIIQLFIEQKLEKKDLPTDTEYYKEGGYVDTDTGEFIKPDGEVFLESDDGEMEQKIEDEKLNQN